MDSLKNVTTTNMKQLILLIGIILLGIKADAQTTHDTASVCMPSEIAKQVAQDLLIGDSAKAMLALTIKELDLTKDKLSYKDSIIFTDKLKELNYIEQVRNEQNQKAGYVALLDNSKKEYAILAKQHKKLKVKKTFTEIILSAGLVTLATLLITK